MAIHDFIMSTLNLTSDSIQEIDAIRKEDHLFYYEIRNNLVLIIEKKLQKKNMI